MSSPADEGAARAEPIYCEAAERETLQGIIDRLGEEET